MNLEDILGLSSEEDRYSTPMMSTPVPEGTFGMPDIVESAPVVDRSFKTETQSNPYDLGGILKRTLDLTSTQLDGRTAQLDKLRDERNSLENYSENNWGSAGTGILSGLAAALAGGSMAEIAGGAYQSGITYYNNLESQEKERRITLDNEIKFEEQRVKDTSDYAQNLGIANINQIAARDLANQKGEIVSQDPNSPYAVNIETKNKADIAKETARANAYSQRYGNRRVVDPEVAKDILGDLYDDGKTYTTDDINAVLKNRSGETQREKIDFEKQNRIGSAQMDGVKWQTPTGEQIIPKDYSIKEVQKAKEILMKKDIVLKSLGEAVRSDGQGLVGSQFSRQRELLGELLSIEKDEKGAGAALTPLEAETYFAAYQGFLANPTTSGWQKFMNTARGAGDIVDAVGRLQQRAKDNFTNKIYSVGASIDPESDFVKYYGIQPPAYMQPNGTPAPVAGGVPTGLNEKLRQSGITGNIKNIRKIR